jgi:UDP-2-acetamido-3-amino-2,3-dideoxy-glucuronate N-acetyltransferase
VRGDVLPYALVVGVPARQVGWMCRCGVRLEIRAGLATCGACGTRYRETRGLLSPVDPA